MERRDKIAEALESHLFRQIDRSERFFWHRLRWRAVREYLPSQTSFELVDVGAGAGLLGKFLKRDRPLATYRFIEPIESLGDVLRGVYGDSADAANDSRFESVDYVTLLDVLEHQENDKQFMKQLVDKMKPGSMLLMTVPALPSLWSPWDVALGHFRRYDKATLLDCIDGIPLVTKEVSFMFPEMLPLGYLRSRRRPGGTKTDLAAAAEFPDLPGLVNDAFYSLGTGSLAMRRHWKAGTSLFLAAQIIS
jgi:SAM-dependent methyltransferase